MQIEQNLRVFQIVMRPVLEPVVLKDGFDFNPLCIQEVYQAWTRKLELRFCELTAV